MAAQRWREELAAWAVPDHILAGAPEPPWGFPVELFQVRGNWPDVAEQTDDADVVVCHHVFYNVPDLVPFAQALTRHARRRVVVELTDQHPLVATRDLWLHFHGIDRPSGPG